MSDGGVLQDVREEAQWDCETVLTTCSNTDNLPTVIGEPRKHRRPQRQEANPAAEGRGEWTQKNGPVDPRARVVRKCIIGRLIRCWRSCRCRRGGAQCGHADRAEQEDGAAAWGTPGEGEEGERCVIFQWR